MTVTYDQPAVGAPARTCPDCGEFLPHACAELVVIRDYNTRNHRARRRVTITDQRTGQVVIGDRRRWL
jgi:hypothetical protein